MTLLSLIICSFSYPLLMFTCPVLFVEKHFNRVNNLESEAITLDLHVLDPPAHVHPVSTFHVELHPSLEPIWPGSELC